MTPRAHSLLREVLDAAQARPAPTLSPPEQPQRPPAAAPPAVPGAGGRGTDRQGTAAGMGSPGQVEEGDGVSGTGQRSRWVPRGRTGKGLRAACGWGQGALGQGRDGDGFPGQDKDGDRAPGQEGAGGGTEPCLTGAVAAGPGGAAQARLPPQQAPGQAAPQGAHGGAGGSDLAAAGLGSPAEALRARPSPGTGQVSVPPLKAAAGRGRPPCPHGASRGGTRRSGAPPGPEHSPGAAHPPGAEHPRSGASPRCGASPPLAGAEPQPRRRGSRAPHPSHG